MTTSWAWILVFPWIQALAQTCPSSYSQPSMKLQGHVIKTYSALRTIDKCRAKCALHANYHSINYYSRQGICEVNNANHLNDPESLVDTAGCQYSNFQSRPVSKCSNKLCSYPLFCSIDNTAEQGYKCFDCEASGLNKAILPYPRKSTVDKVVHNLNAVLRTAFTICMWVQVDPITNSHTPFSYATVGQPNEILVYLENAGSSHFRLNNFQLANFPFVIDGQWHHICGTWENVHGNYVMYIDGIKQTTQRNVQKGHIIKKAFVVLGQDQDSYMGGFQAYQSLQGNLTGVNMWDRVLTAQEVPSIAGRCSFPQGNVLKWDDLKNSRTFGKVKLACQPFCTS